MNNKTIAELEAATAAAKQRAEEANGADEQLNTEYENSLKELESAKSQGLLKSELDKVNKEKGKTELEKALFSKRKIEKRIAELGGNNEEIIEDEEDEDNKPVTVGMLRKIEQSKSVMTAMQMAEEIEDDTERELLKHHLQHSIKSSGKPEEDFRKALAIVNASKNTQILEEAKRKTLGKGHSSGSSAPLKKEQLDDEFTPEEEAYMRPPFNLSKADILKARKK